jgi:hypothetical protein
LRQEFHILHRGVQALLNARPWRQTAVVQTDFIHFMKTHLSQTLLFELLFNVHQQITFLVENIGLQIQVHNFMEVGMDIPAS